MIKDNPEVDIDIHSPKTKTTALHAALIQNQQGFIIDYLISKGADVNAFNNKGFNPVTLAIRHCRPGTQALEKLINSGASLDMFQKGRFIGLTLSDIAVQWNNRDAESFLKRHHEDISTIEKKASINSNDVAKNVKKAQEKSLCPVCHCKVKFPTRMSFLIFNQEQAEKEYDKLMLKQRQIRGGNLLGTDDADEEKNATSAVYVSRKYLDQFISHDDGESYRMLCNIEYHGVSNMHKLRKEISESYSILHVVEKCWIQLKKCKSPLKTKRQFCFENIFLIDLCSGKSLTAALCDVLFPAHKDRCGNRVLAVDKLAPHMVPHFLNNGIAKYLSRDIMSESFFKELEHEVYCQSQQERRTVVLVGMHLCGNLSERAIEFFQKIPLIEAIILSPCCLPKLRNGKNSFTTDSVGDDKIYMDWSNHLKSKMQSVCRNSEVEMCKDLDMHSTKNAIISTIRPTSKS